MSARVMLLVLILTMAAASCGDDAVRPTAPQPTVISRVAIAANAANAVSLFADVSTEHADSIRVRYESAAEASDTTPYYRVDPSGTTRIAVVGLRASTTYSLVAEVVGQGGRIASIPQSATTGDLPATLQSLHLSGSGSPSAGYTLVVPLFPDTSAGADGFVVAFDQAGIVRWYHRFPGAVAGRGEAAAERPHHRVRGAELRLAAQCRLVPRAHAGRRRRALVRGRQRLLHGSS